jgi:hypothetical protein
MTFFIPPQITHGAFLKKGSPLFEMDAGELGDRINDEIPLLGCDGKGF